MRSDLAYNIKVSAVRNKITNREYKKCKIGLISFVSNTYIYIMPYMSDIVEFIVYSILDISFDYLDILYLI